MNSGRFCEDVQHKEAPLLTVCDSSQGLVEGWGVTVIGEGHVDPSREQPPREGESVFVVQQPNPELLIVHLLTLQEKKKKIENGRCFFSHCCQ